MNHGSLFSGIGGFDLAAEWMGWNNKFHCEWNPFGQKVLKYYWPEAESFNDITQTDFTPYANRIDILTGGFPCQPFSTAGRREGTEDERHLWPAMLRAVREIKPRYIVGENVRGLVSWDDGLVFDQVQIDLEAEGYEVIPCLLPASAVNAPHQRFRIWFIAYAERQRLSRPGRRFEPFDTTPDYFKEASGLIDAFQGNALPFVCIGHDGISKGLDKATLHESVKAYGNAIVPQVALQIFKSIEQFNNLLH